MVLYAARFLLICVAIVNSALHFYASIAFLLFLATFVGIEIARSKSFVLALGLAIASTLWVTHFAYPTLLEAAIPKAVSIAVGYAVIARYLTKPFPKHY